MRTPTKKVLFVVSKGGGRPRQWYDERYDEFRVIDVVEEG